LAIDDCPSAQ
jgi:hypothetical protein